MRQSRVPQCVGSTEGEYISVSNGLIERSGTGTHHLVSGIVYSGQWAQDKMNGKGQSNCNTLSVQCSKLGGSV